MESTFLSSNPTASLFSIAKSRNFTSRTSLVSSFGKLNQFGSVYLCRGSSKYRIECLASGGGGSVRKDGDGDSGGGGGGGGEGVVLDHSVSTLSSDVILLQVGGMTCGGCAASVKRILESQPQVSSANVDLTTEVAMVWPSSDAKNGPNWQVQLGEALANHLTNCGFKSIHKGQGSNEEGTPS